MQLLRNSAGVAEVVPSDWLVIDETAEVPDGPAVAVHYSRYLGESERWEARRESWTVQIQPADELLEVSAAILALPEILIAFPAFTDGRGYSHAITLRNHHGYAGELVAVGDVRRDQLEFMRETGFTAYQITGNDTVDDMIASLGELQMPEHRLYSGAAIEGAGS